MKILVTGGTGFLGRHVAWRAADEGAESPDPRRHAPTLVLERPRLRRRFGALFAVGALVLAVVASAIVLFAWRARPDEAQTTNAEPRTPALIEPQIGATVTATATPVASTATLPASKPASTAIPTKATAAPRVAPSGSVKKRRDSELGF